MALLKQNKRAWVGNGVGVEDGGGGGTKQYGEYSLTSF